MSGIYGVYTGMSDNNTGMHINIPDINTVLDIISPWNQAYGKDGHAEYKDSHFLNFGIFEEHITSSPKNDSPILKKDNHLAVIDAILYNREKLTSGGSLSEKLSDEELLFQYVLRNGYESLANVNGDFCGAIYNTETKELVLFRDHMGVRPLLYFRGSEWTAFSSDIRGIAAIPEVPAAPDEEWLYREVCGHYTEDYVKTEIDNVFWVRPASYLVISRKDQAIVYDEHVYWSLGKKKIKLSSEEEYQKRLRELITDSVAKRAAVFPGKVGAELSGGLDSGVIDILLSRQGKEGIYYSWSFSPDDLPLVPNDERQVIADICEQENIVCNYGAMTMDLGPDSNVGKSHASIGLVPDFEFAVEYNYALPLYINTLIICETAQFVNERGGKTVFSGHSGDEGVSHRCDPFEMFYHGEYFHYFKFFYDECEGKKLRALRALKKCYINVKRGRKAASTPFKTYSEAPDILNPAFRSEYGKKKMPALTFAFDSIAYVYSGNTNVRLNVAALLGAYSGARYIFPFVDYRVIDYAVSIPRYLYLHKDQNRYIYRQAFKDIMPKSLYTCTAKNNPSEENLPEDTTDWYVSFDHSRKKVMELLNRDEWKKYLDFDFLDKWAASGRPSEDEKSYNMNVLGKLLRCLRVQLFFDRVRNLNKK